jgi:hypothetical protein
MRRRSSVITFNQPISMPPSSWQQPSVADSRKTSTASTQSNASSNSLKNNVDTANFSYQQPQLMRYPTVFISICVGYNFCIYNLCFCCFTVFLTEHILTGVNYYLLCFLFFNDS